MNNENNKMQVDIENLFKQNVNDLSAIKELYRKLKEVEEKISQIKYIDSSLANKLKKEYEKLKRIILDENIQAKLANDIETINEKLTNDIKTTNEKLTNDIETINEKLTNDIETTNEKLTNDVETITSQLGTIISKNFITPEDFGAIGNGVTNDSLAIDNMFKYAMENKKEVRFKTNTIYYVGTYNFVINKPITVYGNNCIIKHDSSETVLYLFDIYRTNDVYIKDIKFKSYYDIENIKDGGVFNNVNSIYIRYSNRVHLENIILEGCCGVGGHNSTDIVINNYKGLDCDLPLFFQNIDGLQINDFTIRMNESGLNGFQHHVYFNGYIKNCTISNGVIDYPYINPVSDCFDFLNSDPKLTDGYMENIVITNITAKANALRFLKIGEVKNLKVSNVTFESPSAFTVIEHCRTRSFEDVYIYNSSFNLGNVNAANGCIVKESFPNDNSTGNFLTEFNNCNFNINIKDGNSLFLGKANIKCQNCDFKIQGSYDWLQLFTASTNYLQLYKFYNCTFSEIDNKEVGIATGDFNKYKNSNLELVGNYFDSYANSACLNYSNGGFIINNIFKKGKKVIGDESTTITNNNVILKIIT